MLLSTRRWDLGTKLGSCVSSAHVCPQPGSSSVLPFSLWSSAFPIQGELDSSYSPVNTLLKWLLLCDTIPALLFFQVLASARGICLFWRWFSHFITVICWKCLSSALICEFPEQETSTVLHKCPECRDGKEDKKTAEWLLSGILHLKSLVSSPFPHPASLGGAVISLKEEKLIIYFHFQRFHFSVHLTFRFSASY